MSIAIKHEPADSNFENIVRSSFASQGLMTHLGARLVTVEPGRVVIEAPFSHGLSQQRGWFHGGVQGALGDSAGGYAALSLMAAGSEVVSIEFKINFMRPAAGDLLRATGQILRAGRSITVAQVEIDAISEGRSHLAAVMQATFMRVEG